MGFPRSRRQTLLLMRLVRQQPRIPLSVVVDMTAVDHDRAATGDARPAAYVSYVTHCAARALRDRTGANAVLTGWLRPKVTRYDRVTAKVAVDMPGAVRFVAGALVPDADRADLATIDTAVRRFAALDPARAAEFADLRRLWRMPWFIAALGFATAVARPGRRAELLGTFSVSGLGNRPILAFAPAGGTTVSLGVGHVHDAAVVRDGSITIRPVMTLTLVFDHRTIDGALAADLLTDITARLERWPAATAAPAAAAPPVPRADPLAAGRAGG